MGGAAVNVEELHPILNIHPNQKKIIVQTELIYFRKSHKYEVLYSPQLFKVNRNTHEKIFVNLCALLADDVCSVCSLPTNTDASLIVEDSSPICMEIKMIMLW